MVPADYEGFFLNAVSKWVMVYYSQDSCLYLYFSREKSSSASWRLWLNQLIKEIISYETYLLLYRNMYICVFEYHGEGHFSTSGGDMHRNKSLCGIFASSFPFCFASSHHWRFSYSELFINYVAFNFQDNEEETWYVNTASHAEQQFWCNKLQSPCLCKSTLCYAARIYQKKKLKSQFWVQFLVDFTLFYCTGYWVGLHDLSFWGKTGQNVHYERSKAKVNEWHAVVIYTQWEWKYKTEEKCRVRQEESSSKLNL